MSTVSFRPPVLLALLVLLGAGCTGGSSTLGARFNGPTALAPFVGITAKVPGVLRPYVAVANSRGDELRIVDPADDAVVIGPGLIFPLAVPTLATRPTRLVSASLGDGGADLLVALGAGSVRLELVSTWDAVTRVVRAIDLGDPQLVQAGDPLLQPGDEILSLAAAPLPAIPGRARVFAGISGGRLAVIEFGRSGEAIELSAAPRVRPFSQPLEVLDLAAAPTGDRVFCATLDELRATDGRAVHGVAQVDLPATLPAGPLVPVGLDALAPTRLVALARLSERSLIDSEVDKFTQTNRLQVYAILDASACGVNFPINCGLATILPASGDSTDQRGGKGGIQTDPMGEQPYRAPIFIPGVVTSIAVGPLPAADPPLGEARQVSLNPGVGHTPTTAVLAATSTAGVVYFVDLGRMALPSNVSYVASTGATQAVGASRITLTGESGLGLLDKDLKVVTTSAAMDAVIDVTPGYTGDDDWTIAWRGILPIFSSADAVAVIDTDPVLGRYATFKAPSGLAAPASPWKATAVVDRPELGVRVGDLVEIQVAQSTATAGCFHDPVDAANPDGLVRARVAEVVPRDAAQWPGGALRLAADPADTLGCLASLTTPVAGLGRVRAQGLLLSGLSFGYAGRPDFDVPYALRWEPEDPLLPADALNLIKKVRRRAYPPSSPCTVAPCQPDPPLTKGPAVKFTVAKVDPLSGDPFAGTSITFHTQSAFSPMSRQPAGGAAIATGVVALDRGTEDLHFFASFIDDQVVDIPTGLGQGSTVSIR
jgi:hypothetical protein